MSPQAPTSEHAAARPSRLVWPDRRDFAFTIVDDPDMQTTAIGREVYSFLESTGLRTTRLSWPLAPTRLISAKDDTCGLPEHVDWLRRLHAAGFEIGFHNATFHTSTRAETIAALERFHELFGAEPSILANHFENAEGMYWGSARLSGWRRLVYNAATRWRNENRFFGHTPGHELFWGDLCRQHVRYVRNFVFRNIDTLEACPFMPYHDPRREYVQDWFASSDGGNRDSFVDMLSERNQDFLEERGGACVLYTHFGFGFVQDGKLDPRVQQLVKRLSRKRGWFVPASALLDYIRERRGPKVLTDSERSRLETRWLIGKLRHGTS